LVALECTKKELEKELADHKTLATRARKYYKASIDRCKEQWAKTEQLTKMQALTRRDRIWKERSIALLPNTSNLN